MRRSKDATAESRRAIIETASRLFRQRGLQGVGVADVMQAAGMTHGGFYRHFPSKDALVADAMAHAFGEVSARLESETAADGSGPLAVMLRAYVDDYLSAEHVVHTGRGCPIAAVGSEAQHAGVDVGASFAQGTERLVQRLTAALAGTSPTPREAALQLLARLVGSIIIARAVGEGALQREMVAAMRADPTVKQALTAPSS